VRRNAIAAKANFQIWTGSKDVLQLPDESGKLFPLYLANDTLNQPVIPVPE